MLDADRVQRAGRGAAATLLLVLSLALVACQPTGQPTPPPLAPTPTPAPMDTPDTTPADGPSPAVTPATPSPADTPLPDTTPSAEGWLYLADFPAGEALEVSSVVALDGGFVAAGFESYPGEGIFGRRTGVVWTSDDGYNWNRTTPAVFDLVAPLFMVRLDDMVYVFGEYATCAPFDEGCREPPDAGVTVWRSTDGAEWEQLPVPDLMRDALLDGVTVGLDRLIVFGAAGDDLLPIVWSSLDGGQWNEVTDIAGLTSIAVLAAGPERLVAFGTEYVAADDDVATLAAHSDGGAFQPAQLPPGQRGIVEAATWGPSGFVAVGTMFQETADHIPALALASTDGVIWTAASTAQLPDDVGFGGLLALSDGYLAIGQTPVLDEFDLVSASSWFSRDGLTWEPHAQLDGGDYRQLTGSAIGPAGAIVFATEFAEDEDDLDDVLQSVHAWFAPPTSLP